MPLLEAAGDSAKAQIPPPYAFVDAYSHRTPYVMEYLLNVQRQLGRCLVARAGEGGKGEDQKGDGTGWLHHA